MEARWTTCRSAAGCLLFLVAGCVAVNPKFLDSGSGTGEESASGTTTSQPETGGTGRKEATSHGSSVGDTTPTATEPGDNSASVGTSSRTTSSSSGADTGLDTGVQFDLGGPTKPADIVLFASERERGNFLALAGGISMVAAESCGGVLDSVGIDLICAGGPFFIVGSSAQPLPALEGIHEELGTHRFVDISGDELVLDYDALLEGDVPVDFAERVELAPDPDGSTFWWGDAGGGEDDCGGWMATDLDAAVRSFDVSPASDAPDACGESHYVLCACVPDR